MKQDLTGDQRARFWNKSGSGIREKICGDLKRQKTLLNRHANHLHRWKSEGK
jgi:hypothetical protein